MSNWNLEVFYPNKDAWTKDLELLQNEIPKLGNFKGKLANFDDFKAYHVLEESVIKLLYKVYPYAHLSSDLNLKDIEASNLNQQVMFTLSKLGQVSAYVAPEIISLGEEKVLSFVKQDALLTPYEFSFKKLFRGQKHVLDDVCEKILANFSTIRSIPTSLHQSLSIIDRKDEIVKLSDGTKVAVNQANYRVLIENSKTPKDRKLIFTALYKRYVDNKSAFAATYNLVLQQLSANYKSRNYNSALEAALFNNNIPESVFLNLKDVVYKNTKPLKRYIKLRKQALGLKKYYTYDRFLPLAKNDKTYSYEESKTLFFDSIADFSPEFVANQKKALENGFVDVSPKDGKRTGAYSSGFYGHHPFILLNHNDTLDSVFTLAHEAGHSAHTIFSNDAQPMATADYTIFVAEIASTFNEHALLDYLLKKAETKEEKLELLTISIDNISSTFYRQVLFAHYEYEANNLVASGKPVNEQSLSQIMIDLYKHYYGLDITKEPGKQYVWAHIPHVFNSPFYVYQYATSFAASLKIYSDVKSGKEHAFDNYLSMLKSGGSEYPVDQAKKGGADLTDKKTFLAVVNRLNELLDLLDETLNAW